MSKYAAFMAGAAEKIDNKMVVVSQRFKDEQGNPIPWEIKALTAAENDELQRGCMVNVPIPGKRGQFSRELDQTKYTAMLLAESVVEPNLHDAELQDSYGVKSAEALLSAMLCLNEYNILAEAVTGMGKFESLPELVEAAKN